MIVRVAHPADYQWLKDRAGVSPSHEFKALEAVRPDGSISGMVGFDGWTPNAVTLHIALDSPAALRQLIRAGFMMAFEVCKRDLALCVVRSDNERSLRLCAHLGFKQAARIMDAWGPGIDFVVFQMKRRDCRWLRQARKAA